MQYAGCKAAGLQAAGCTKRRKRCHCSALAWQVFKKVSQNVVNTTGIGARRGPPSPSSHGGIPPPSLPPRTHPQSLRFIRGTRNLTHTDRGSADFRNTNETHVSDVPPHEPACHSCPLFAPESAAWPSLQDCTAAFKAAGIHRLVQVPEQEMLSTITVAELGMQAGKPTVRANKSAVASAEPGPKSSVPGV